MRLTRYLLGAKKLPAITSKRGNKNFYKGRGAPSAGTHTPFGGYLLDPAKIATITFVAPDLKGFPLKPYVSRVIDENMRIAANAAIAARKAASSSSSSSSSQ